MQQRFRDIDSTNEIEFNELIRYQIFRQVFDALEGDLELELGHERSRVVQDQDVANVDLGHG